MRHCGPPLAFPVVTRRAGGTTPGGTDRIASRRLAVARRRHTRASADREHAETAECDDPVLSRVSTHAEGMGQGDGPRRVGQPVDAPPGAGLQARSQQTGDEDGHHEIKSQRAQTHPEPAVGRGERHDDGEPSDMDVGVEEARDHVDGQKHHGHDRDTAVNLLLGKAGPVACPGATGGRQPEDHGHSEEDQGARCRWPGWRTRGRWSS